MFMRLGVWWAAFAAAGASWPLEPAREVFDNGLVAIVAEDHAHPVAAVRVYVRCGSMYEGEFLGAGVSHYVEHLLGEQTDKRDKAQLEAAVAEMGGAYNAYTWKDIVCYHMAVRSERAADAASFLEETVFHAQFPPASVDNQRDIILNEIRMGRDEPGRVLQNTFYAAMFREHPVRYPIIGYEELFRKLTGDDVQRYYERFYVPERAVVVVVGDVDAAATLARLRATFGALPRGRPVADPPYVEPPQLGRRDATAPMDIEGAYLWLGFRGPRLGTKEAFALEVAAAIAGEGRASRLYRRVLEEGGYVTSISAWFNSTPGDYAYLGVYAEGEALELNYAEEAIVAEMLRFAEKPVTKRELARAKKLIAAKNTLGLQTVEDVAEELGEGEVYAGNMNYRLEAERQIDAVTARDVMDAAARYIRADNMTVARVVPRDWAAAAAPAGGGGRAEAMTRVTLPNGLRLLVKRNPSLDAVNISAAVGGGSRVVAPGREGVAELAAELLVKGTKKRSGEKIADEVEGMGATLGATASLDYVLLSAEGLGEDFPKIFDVFADCLTGAAIPPDDFGLEQDRLLSQVQSEDDDWELAAEKLMRAAVYPHHPYRYLTTGTYESVDRVTREDVLAYYEKYFTPANVVVAVVGDVDPAAVERLARAKLGGWYPPASPSPVIPQDAPHAAPEEITKQTDNEQAVVYFGYWGARWGDDDAFALRVLDAALSGVGLPGGRLHTRLRGEGLVYVVHAYEVFGVDPGFFAIYAAASPVNADKVVAIIEEEVEKVKQAPITAEELALAQENWLTMNALYDRQTNGDLAELSARDELVGLGYDWRDRFDERVKAVTAAEVMAAAQKYLVNPVIVVTSPAAAPAAEGAGK